MEKIAVERSIWINAPRERVWHAVTQPEHLDQWYATYYRWDIPALHVGATVRFYNKDNHTDMQIATIEVVDPPREFTVRWQPDKEYPAMTLVTTFMLEEANGGTRPPSANPATNRCPPRYASSGWTQPAAATRCQWKI